jgi:hypothetical protein
MSKQIHKIINEILTPDDLIIDGGRFAGNIEVNSLINSTGPLKSYNLMQSNGSLADVFKSLSVPVGLLHFGNMFDKHMTFDSDSDSDSETNNGPKIPKTKSKTASGSGVRHRPPVPPEMSNSSDKKPGFINDDTKYTFLDKAQRNYSGPSPRADDASSVTQKHQSGKSGYCYIGEDRGFRSCAKVEPGDKCMSGQVFSRQDICVNPTLRE